jgi:hypothetical protein
MTTTNERLANEMDRDVYRLAEWAQREADQLRAGNPRREQWERAAKHLRAADSALWSLMSASDRTRLNTAALDASTEAEEQDEQLRYETETRDLSDDRDALASAGFIEEA